MFESRPLRVATATAVMAIACLGCSPAKQQSSTPAEKPAVTESTPAEAQNSTSDAAAIATEQNQSGAPTEQVAANDGSADKYRGLLPFEDEKNVPEITEVTTIEFKTDAGDIIMEVYPQAAPNAAKRFIELCEEGFYDDTPIFRVVDGFVAQFGINWRPDHKKWQDNNFNDDPSLFQLQPGTLAFAKAGPNTNSTQVFINYGENSPLKYQGNFTTFGRITEGFDNTKKFVAVGDPSMGLDQGQLWDNGGKYLESLPTKPTMIISAKVIKPEAKDETKTKAEGDAKTEPQAENPAAPAPAK